MSNAYPQGTRQFILWAGCDDEYVEPQPTWAVVTITPEWARELMKLMGIARELKDRLRAEHDAYLDQFRLMLGRAGDFVESSDNEQSNKIDALYTGYQLGRNNEVALVPVGHELLPDEIELANEELRMECSRLHIHDDHISISAYTKYSSVLCYAPQIDEEWVCAIAEGRSDELDALVVREEAA